MTIFRSRRPAAFVIAFLLSAIVAPCASMAQEQFPSKSINMIVGYAPGGPSDVLARAVASMVSDSWKQQVIVENRAGGGGTIAATAVARSNPDGYTWALNGTSAFVINEAVRASPPFETLKTFRLVALLATQTNTVLVRADLGITTMKQLIDAAKAAPGKLTYGTPGIATPPHLSFEILKQATGMDITHVPFSGNAPATTALLSNDLHMLTGTPQVAKNLVEQKKVVALAAMATTRTTELPDVPTLAELGYPPGLQPWYGIAVPINTPQAVVSIIDAKLTEIMARPEMKQILLQAGFDTTFLGSADFAEMVKKELITVKQAVKDARMTVE